MQQSVSLENARIIAEVQQSTVEDQSNKNHRSILYTLY